jgi:5-formyltetrahydrofolate cyclo-ligase
MPADLAAEKRRLRRLVAERRRAVAPAEAARAAARIAERLLAEPVVRAARRIALYAALPDEVPTRPLFDAFAVLDRPLLLPRIVGEAALAFAAVADWSALAPGRYGVLEPPAQAETAALAEGDLVLVPGVAFDRAGHRLGRGGGFYDRAFPPGAPRPPFLIGVAFELQLVAAVPHGAGDRRMQAVVTEAGFTLAAERER